jgi:hypothetical protein
VVADKLAARGRARGAAPRSSTGRGPRKIEARFRRRILFTRTSAKSAAPTRRAWTTRSKRGQATVSLWKKFNARRAAETPPKPAFEVGEFAVAALTAAMEGLPGQTQTIETERSKLRDKTSDRDAAAEKGDEIQHALVRGVGGRVPARTRRSAMRWGRSTRADTSCPRPRWEITGLAPADVRHRGVTHANDRRRARTYLSRGVEAGWREDLDRGETAV